MDALCPCGAAAVILYRAPVAAPTYRHVRERPTRRNGWRAGPGRWERDGSEPVAGPRRADGPLCHRCYLAAVRDVAVAMEFRPPALYQGTPKLPGMRPGGWRLSERERAAVLGRVTVHRAWGVEPVRGAA